MILTFDRLNVKQTSYFRNVNLTNLGHFVFIFYDAELGLVFMTQQYIRNAQVVNCIILKNGQSKNEKEKERF